MLTDYLGGDSMAGTKMKSTSGWKNNGNGTNSSGFNGLPGGYRGSYGDFNGIGFVGFWWSSSEGNTNDAWYRFLLNDAGNVDSDGGSKRGGFSVRCIKE